MSKRMPCSDEFKDKHLDMMLQMAYKYENALKSQQMLDELEEAGKKCSEADARDAFALFLKKCEQQEAQAKRQARRARARRIIRRTVEVAACVVLVMAIATPFAIAKVDVIRVKVMELLIDIKDDHTELSFVEDEDAAFEVPAGWKGAYYPAYIPQGYYVIDMSELFCIVYYSNDEMQDFSFGEFKQAAATDINSENAIISYVDVNGANALLLENDDYTTLTWAYEDRYFIIDGYLTKEEALKIARSVRRI